jgi:hypothetical protein
MSTAWEESFILAGSGGSDPITNSGLEEHSRHDDRLPHAGLNFSSVTPSVRAGDVLGLKAACARASLAHRRCALKAGNSRRALRPNSTAARCSHASL